MESVSEILFSHWYEKHFDDKKMHIQEFLTVYNPIDVEVLDPIFECIRAEAGVSFQVGFQTAVQLLLGRQ